MRELRNTLRRLSPENQRRFLRYCRWLRICEYFHTPAPVAFSLRVSVFTFVLLAIMPAHPLSLAITFGGALAFALIIQPTKGLPPHEPTP